MLPAIFLQDTLIVQLINGISSCSIFLYIISFCILNVFHLLVQKNQNHHNPYLLILLPCPVHLYKHFLHLQSTIYFIHLSSLYTSSTVVQNFRTTESLLLIRRISSSSPFSRRLTPPTFWIKSETRPMPMISGTAQLQLLLLTNHYLQQILCRLHWNNRKVSLSSGTASTNWNHRTAMPHPNHQWAGSSRCSCQSNQPDYWW